MISLLSSFSSLMTACRGLELIEFCLASFKDGLRSEIVLLEMELRLTKGLAGTALFASELADTLIPFPVFCLFSEIFLLNVSFLGLSDFSSEFFLVSTFCVGCLLPLRCTVFPFSGIFLDSCDAPSLFFSLVFFSFSSLWK